MMISIKHERCYYIESIEHIISQKIRSRTSDTPQTSRRTATTMKLYEFSFDDNSLFVPKNHQPSDTFKTVPTMVVTSKMKTSWNAKNQSCHGLRTFF